MTPAARGLHKGAGRQRSADALATRSALKDLNQNWPKTSQPGVEPPLVVRGAPIPVFLAPQTVDVRALAAKMRDRIRTRPEGVLLDTHACRSSMHSQRHTFSAEQVFAHRHKRIFVFFVPQEGFSRAARLDPRKLRAVAQKLSRSPKTARCSAKAQSCSSSHVLRRSSRRIIFACIFFTSTDLGGGGLVQAGGLGAALRSLVSPQRCTTTCFVRLPNPHAAVWTRNPTHILALSVTALLLSNNTLTHAHAFSSVFVGVRMSLIV